MTYAPWLARLTRLRKARNNAPHKPLLLLVFLDMVERGKYTAGPLHLTVDLVSEFSEFFGIVTYRRPVRPDIRLPFHHLGSDGFWTTFTASGEPSLYRPTTSYVVPNPEFADACHDEEFRNHAKRILIATHFEPAERNALYNLVGIPIPDDDQIARDAQFANNEDAATVGRSARFRIDIVSAYNYTCALTGYRVTTMTLGAIVDAAHIHEYKDSRNNDPQNGLALCRNAHWLFDAGLWSIDDEYQVLVNADAFTEVSPNQQPLKEMHGKRLLLPNNSHLWPAKKHMAWHRRHFHFE